MGPMSIWSKGSEFKTFSIVFKRLFPLLRVSRMLTSISNVKYEFWISILVGIKWEVLIKWVLIDTGLKGKEDLQNKTNITDT